MVSIASDFLAWQSKVTEAKRQEGCGLPEEIAFAIYEASRLRHLAASPKFREEIASPNQAREFNERAMELAAQVVAYIENIYGTQEEIQKDALWKFSFEKFDNLRPGSYAFSTSDELTLTTEGAINFFVPLAPSDRFVYEHKKGVNAARDEIMVAYRPPIIDGKAEVLTPATLLGHACASEPDAVRMP